MGGENPEFAYPPIVLEFIRKCCPEDIVGEIRENARKVTMTEFCSALKLPEAVSSSQPESYGTKMPVLDIRSADAN